MNFIKRKYWLEILLHVLAWIVIYYVVDSLGSVSRFTINLHSTRGAVVADKGEFGQKTVSGSLYPLSLIVLGFLMLLFYSNAFWLYNKLVKLRNGYLRFAIVIAWFAALFFIDYFLVGYLKNSMEPETIHILKFVIPNPAKLGWVRVRINILLIFLFTLGASIAYFFSKAWIANELIRKQLEANQLSTEIKFLKSQINPHFLFNTLNNLFSMAQSKGNEELADGISRLSAMMRYMLYESNVERVPLRKEIEYLENCILLNRLRYADDEVNVNFNYPEQIDSLFIAPMLFVPFVENAFKYGVLVGQPWHIDMGVGLAGNEVIFTCTNKNYSFVAKMDDSTRGIGLENVKRRLQLLYPGKHTLTIKSDADNYAVELKINLE